MRWVLKNDRFREMQQGAPASRRRYIPDRPALAIVVQMGDSLTMEVSRNSVARFTTVSGCVMLRA
jgi:hypothetical protein